MAELEFSRRLRQYRRDRKLTQQELADLLGVSNKSVSRWESGSYPDVALLGPLAEALGVTVDDLLGTRGPVRTLTKADWQSVLSFVFALGGGILFFALRTFTPILIAYLLYIASMAYGVYLQRHYAYRSTWFHLSNLVMNFFVNLTLVSVFFLLIPFFSEFLYLDLNVYSFAAVLTAITTAVIYLSGRPVILPKEDDPPPEEEPSSEEEPPKEP